MVQNTRRLIETGGRRLVVGENTHDCVEMGGWWWVKTPAVAGGDGLLAVAATLVVVVCGHSLATARGRVQNPSVSRF